MLGWYQAVRTFPVRKEVSASFSRDGNGNKAIKVNDTEGLARSTFPIAKFPLPTIKPQAHSKLKADQCLPLIGEGCY